MRADSSAPIHWLVWLDNPAGHLFGVRLTLARPDLAGQTLSLPAWIPGSYMIRDFARNLLDLRASCDSEPVALTQLDKQTWRCAPCDGPLTLEYRVYAWDLSVRSAHLDTTHGFFNGTSLCLRAWGQEQQPHRLRIRLPESGPCADWRIATSLHLDPEGDKRDFLCADYDELIDHPVELGTFTHGRFQLANTPHNVAITGRTSVDMLRLQCDLPPILNEHIALFGELPPMPAYWFLVTATGDGYGGLEHCESTALLCSRDDLPLIGESTIDAGYRRFLGLCSHEYFHLWNVKRIRPQAFIDGGLEREVHSTLLWAFEGITSYYDDLALVRSGIIPQADYLLLLAENITRLQRNLGRQHQSVSQSSFDAWTRFYKQDENAINAIVSYYTKGSLIALCLDLTLRLRSEGRISLDDLMRALWQRHGKTGLGVAEDGIERLAEQISGLDLSDFFEPALRGTEDLPLESLLRAFGVGLRLRPARDAGDLGDNRAPKADQPTAAPALDLGLNLARGNEPRVAQVLENGPAQLAGLSAGDLLIACNGLRVTSDNLRRLLQATEPGQPVTLHAFRRDELMEFQLTPRPAPADTCSLWLLDEIDEATRARRQGWLASLAQASATIN